MKHEQIDKRSAIWGGWSFSEGKKKRKATNLDQAEMGEEIGTRIKDYVTC